MLILTRWEDQKIHIGENVTVKIIKTAGNRVRLGIEAPKECLILRKECEDNRKAQQDDGDNIVCTRYNQPQHTTATMYG